MRTFKSLSKTFRVPKKLLHELKAAGRVQKGLGEATCCVAICVPLCCVSWLSTWCSPRSPSSGSSGWASSMVRCSAQHRVLNQLQDIRWTCRGGRIPRSRLASIPPLYVTTPTLCQHPRSALSSQPPLASPRTSRQTLSQKHLRDRGLGSKQCRDGQEMVKSIEGFISCVYLMMCVCHECVSYLC